MEKNVTLHVLGVRGSNPMASPEYMEFGGNTSCMVVNTEETAVIFDMGSGITNLTRGALRDGINQKKRLDIFFSHVHLDHVIGLFSFSPLFDPEQEIHIYGEARDGKSFQVQLRTIVGPPYWPVGFDYFPAKIRFHEISAGDEIALPGDIQVKTIRGYHPNDSILYRMESGDKSIVYGLDCEMNEEMEERLVGFARDADILIFDAHFLPEDFSSFEGWGHATWEDGARIRKKAGVKKLLLTHYAPQYTDQILRDQEAKLQAADSDSMFAKEGMEIKL